MGGDPGRAVWSGQDRFFDAVDAVAVANLAGRIGAGSNRLVRTIIAVWLLGRRGGPLHCLDPRLNRLDGISRVHACFRTGFGSQRIGDALPLLRMAGVHRH